VTEDIFGVEYWSQCDRVVSRTKGAREKITANLSELYMSKSFWQLSVLITFYFFTL
jgi:hypothetical protein